MTDNQNGEGQGAAPAGGQDWQQWTEGVDWSDWRSWLQRLAATDWAATDWTSSETNVLTVSSSGLITAVGGGKATVSATVGGVTASSASITVTSTAVTLGIAASGTNVVLSWPSGTLVEATNLLGPWITNSAAVSPFTVAATNTSEFFKILLNP